MVVSGMPETAMVGFVTETTTDHSTSFLSLHFQAPRALRPPVMVVTMMAVAKNVME